MLNSHTRPTAAALAGGGEHHCGNVCGPRGPRPRPEPGGVEAQGLHQRGTQGNKCEEKATQTVSRRGMSQAAGTAAWSSPVPEEGGPKEVPTEGTGAL